MKQDTGRSELVWEGLEEALLRPEALIHKGLGRAGSWGRGVGGEKEMAESSGELNYVTAPTAPRASHWSWGWVGLGDGSG